MPPRRRVGPSRVAIASERVMTLQFKPDDRSGLRLSRDQTTAFVAPALWPAVDRALRPPASGADAEFDAAVTHILQASPAASAAPFVMVVGRSACEGATTVSVGLARAFARNGAAGALLVTDTERRGPARRLVQAAPVPDAASPAGACRAATTADGLTLMPLNATPEIAIWRSENESGAVVIDAGALDGRLPYVIRPLVSYALLVVNARTTTLPMLERLRSVLDAKKFEVDGIILNRRRHYIPKFLYGLTR